jgi:peptidase S41-like protein/PDZ domain-containing protein
LGWLLGACAPTVPHPVVKPATPWPPTSATAVLFGDAVEKVREQYVDEIPVEWLGVAALRGLEKVPPKGVIRVLANPRGATLVHAASGSEEVTASVLWAPNPRPIDVGRALDKAADFVVERLGTRPSEVDDALLRGLISVDRRGVYFDANAYHILADGSKSGTVEVAVEIRNNVLTVASRVERGSEEQSGLRAGDQILEIDGVSTEGLALPVATQLLRGDPGSRAELLVKRDEWSVPRMMMVTRTVTKREGVRRKLFGSVGYIGIRQLAEGTAGEVRSSAEALRAEGARSLVLDLRRNSGGLLTAAVEVTELFLSKGQMIMATSGRDRRRNMRFEARRPPKLDEPLAVVVDGTTAGGGRNHHRRVAGPRPGRGRGGEDVWEYDDSGICPVTQRRDVQSYDRTLVHQQGPPRGVRWNCPRRRNRQRGEQ